MNCEALLRKLSLPQSRDAALRVFGASSHRYKLNAVASTAAIAAFEQGRQVQLPTDYRDFLLDCGNGGAGDQGIVPVTDREGGRLSFAAWYVSWLDAALDGRDFAVSIGASQS